MCLLLQESSQAAKESNMSKISDSFAKKASGNCPGLANEGVSGEAKLIDADADETFSWILSLPVKNSCFGGRMRWHTMCSGEQEGREVSEPSVEIESGGEVWIPYYSIAAEAREYDSDRGMVHCVAVHQCYKGLVSIFSCQEPRSIFMALGHALGLIGLCQRQGQKQIIRLRRSGLAIEAGEFPSVQFLKEVANVFPLSCAGIAIFPGADNMALKVARMAGYIFGMFSEMKFHVFENDQGMVDSFKSLRRVPSSDSGSSEVASTWVSSSDYPRYRCLIRGLAAYLQPGEVLQDVLDICGCDLDNTGNVHFGLQDVDFLGHQSSSVTLQSHGSGLLDDGTRSITSFGVESMRNRRTLYTGDRCFSKMEQIPEEDEEE